MFFKKPTIKEPVVTWRTPPPPKGHLSLTKNLSWIPYPFLFILTSCILQSFSLNEPAPNLPFAPKPALLLSLLPSFIMVLYALFDFLTEFLIVWTLLFSVFNSLPDPTSQSLEFPWIRETLAASDHSFLFDGGGVSLNKLTSYVSYHACQTKFLHFPPKTEEWNKNLNTDHGAAQNMSSSWNKVLN